MRKLVLGTSFALFASIGTALNSAQSVEAKPIEASSTFFTSQLLPGAGDTESLDPTLDPVNSTLDPIPDAADYYAFVDSFDGQTLYVRLADGTTQSFTFPEGIGGADYNLNPGDLIAVNADKDDIITGLDNPVVDTEFIGEVTSFDGAELVATSVTGEVKRTPVSEAVATRLNLQPGDEVKVTTFQNIEGMSSICKVKRAEVPAPPQPQPEVFTQPAPPPAVAPVIDGLW